MKPRRGDISSPLLLVNLEKTIEIENYLRDELPHLLEEDLFVVEIVIKGHSNKPLIYLLIDGDEGITIDKCAEISRKIRNILEETLLLNDYVLEVSSPGVDKPLKLKRQYHRHQGRRLKVNLQDERILTGELLKVNQDTIKLAAEKKVKKKMIKEELDIPFNEIAKTKVLVSFK